MPFTLWKHILADLARLSVLCAVALATLLGVAATIPPLSNGRLDAADAVVFAALAFVPMLAYVLPFAAAFAATIVYHRVSSSNEANAAYAGGISHKSLLVPALTLGLGAAITLTVLNEQVIPRFLRRMAELVTVDAARLLAQEVERGRAVSLDSGPMIFADQAQRVAPAPGSAATDQVEFSKFAAIVLDEKGVPRQELTAGRATMWLYPPGALPRTAEDDGRDSSVIVADLDTVIAGDASGLGGFRDTSRFQFRVPNPFRENPKFFTFGELRRLPGEPDRINWIDARRRALAGEAGRADAEERLATVVAAGGLTFTDAHGKSVDVRAGGVERDGEALRLVPARGADVVEVFHTRSGDRSRFAELHTIARGARLLPAAAGYTLELTGFRTRESGSGRTFASSAERTRTQLGPLTLRPSPAEAYLAMTTPELIDATAGMNAAGVAAARRDLAERWAELRREVLSKQHERMAMSGSLLVIALAGAVTALHRAQGLPLTTYAWTFIPAVLTLVTIAGGQQLTEQSGPAGLPLLWGGAGALLLYVVWRFRRLARH
ncbi:MAG TPA: LptF/LptG family permease [Phycisphaerales bacterium]|nr:LptF/LptG family permease [Phycisphaerales bacterium]